MLRYMSPYIFLTINNLSSNYFLIIFPIVKVKNQLKAINHEGKNL